ncbi:oxidoreductase [uncultured Jatrophihabitans sp.]|uniref:oxidoreductase n=1 Tax=uncultured Jatrophihabitans sp. TaxID=1610747 RepID=UPI0035CA51DC
MAKWRAADIPDQSGRTFVVTGANSGLGEATARALAAHGARVVLACRNTDKGEAAAAGMSGDVRVRALDLADLVSVRRFAEELTGEVGEIDVLVNNAGVMAVPEKRTADGFEMQFGTNFLGHYALTGLLLPAVRDRVVTLSSIFHYVGRINLGDLNWQRRHYRRWGAYAQSKLADLMFAHELGRRLAERDSTVISSAAHPGYASTELQSHTESIQDRILGIGNTVMAQDAEHGALPELYAATMPDVVNGAFYGPDGPGELRGHPHRVRSSKASRDPEVAAKLWERAREMTGVTVLAD